MELEFRKDFEEVASRWDEFWRGGKNLNRPNIYLLPPKNGCQPVNRPDSLIDPHADYNRTIDQVLRWAATHEFMAEAVPYFRIYFGPDHFSALLGAELTFNSNEKTSWCVPFVENWEDVELKFDPNGKWWQATAKVISDFRAQLDGRVIVAGPHLQSGLDCLSAIRGPQNLLIDLMTVPEHVERALAQAERAHEEIVAALREVLDVPTYGSATRHDLYCSGFVDVMQSDISAMLSEDMFAAIEIPRLTREADRLDAVSYHLDGPDAIRHLDALCAIKKLGVIQWQPGVGTAAQKYWKDLYRSIDMTGKGQVRFGTTETILRDWAAFTSKQLFYRVGSDSVDDAKRIIDTLERVQVHTNDLVSD